MTPALAKAGRRRMRAIARSRGLLENTRTAWYKSEVRRHLAHGRTDVGWLAIWLDLPVSHVQAVVAEVQAEQGGQP